MNEKIHKIRVLDFLVLLARYRLFLFFNTFILSVATIVIVLILPQSYTSRTVILPPEESSSMGILSSIPKSLPFSNFLTSSLMENTTVEGVFVAIFNSFRLRDAVIERFNIIELYDFPDSYYIEDVYERLNENIALVVTDEGTMEIWVDDESPQRAAAMADFIVETMDRIYREISREKVQQRKDFMEGRLITIKKELREAEDDLVIFQKEHKVISIDEQTRAAIEASARAEALYQNTALEYKIAKKIYSGDNATLRKLRMTMEELRAQAKQLSVDRINDAMIPLAKSPELGVKYLRLKRAFKIKEFLFELITEQYETIKFEEAKNIQHLQILDKASIPEKRSSPKRRNIVIIVFVISILQGIFFVLLFNGAVQLTRHRTDTFYKIREILLSIPLVGSLSRKLYRKWIAPRAGQSV